MFTKKAAPGAPLKRGVSEIYPGENDSKEEAEQKLSELTRSREVLVNRFRSAREEISKAKSKGERKCECHESCRKLVGIEDIEELDKVTEFLPSFSSSSSSSSSARASVRTTARDITWELREYQKGILKPKPDGGSILRSATEDLRREDFEDKDAKDGTEPKKAGRIFGGCTI